MTAIASMQVQLKQTNAILYQYSITSVFASKLGGGGGGILNGAFIIRYTSQSVGK